jgi:hypothetical protein
VPAKPADSDEPGEKMFSWNDPAGEADVKRSCGGRVVVAFILALPTNQ